MNFGWANCLWTAVVSLGVSSFNSTVWKVSCSDPAWSGSFRNVLRAHLNSTNRYRTCLRVKKTPRLGFESQINLKWYLAICAFNLDLEWNCKWKVRASTGTHGDYRILEIRTSSWFKAQKPTHKNSIYSNLSKRSVFQILN